MGEKRIINQEASDEIYNDDWFLKDSVLHDTKKVQPSVIKEYMNQGMATSQDLADEVTARQNMDSQLASGIGKQMSNLADFYDTTTSYVVGDVCVLQSGELMRCIAPTSGSFDNTKWEPVTVDELFDDLNFSADAISYDNTSSGLEADNVQDAIDETITKLSAVGSASGDIASFNDGSNLPMPKLEVAIEPVQEGSGDPSPENIRPISGWDEVNVTRCGKNLFDKTTFTVKKFLTSDGRIETSDNWSISDYIGVKGGTAYILSGVTNAGTVAYHCFYDKDKNFISSVISTTQNFTTPSNAVYVRLSMRTETPDAVQLEYGNTATAYEPYNPNSHTYTIDLDGTRYGGKVDLVSGVMTVDRVGVDLGSLTWTNRNSDSAGVFSSTGITNYNWSDSISFMCSNYKPNGTVISVTQMTNRENGVVTFYYQGTSSTRQIYIKDLDKSSMTGAEFKTAMNGVQLVYELATPLTIQLSPTVVKSLRGMNNVVADTGAILDAEYIRDLTTIIDYILEQLNA